MKNFLKKNPTDRTKEYWQNAARQDLESTMELICDGFDKHTFDTEPTQFTRFVLAHIYSINAKKVLDLACGIGRNCKWVSPKVEMYYGVDFIDDMISKAIKYNHGTSNAVFYVNDGAHLKDPPEYFDLIFSELAFQHMPKKIQDSYISEVLRTLRQYGLFLVQIPKMDFYHDATYARTDDELKKMFEKFEYRLLDGHHAYYTVAATKI